MPAAATLNAINAAAAPFSNYLAVGDSITFGAYLETLANGYPYQIASHYGLQPNDQGVSGATVSSYAPMLYGLTVPQGNRSLITYQLGTNDVTSGVADTYQQQDYGQGILSQLAYLAVPAANRVNATNFIYAGTTAPGTYGISEKMTASGSTATFTVTGSTIYLSTVMQATYGSGGAATLTVDGASNSAILLFNGYGSENIAEGPLTALSRITGLSSGPHTVVVTCSGAGTVELAWAAGFSTPSSSANVFIGATPDRQVMDANTASYRPYQSAAAATLTSDGLKVTYVAGSATAVSKTIGYYNLLHPNDLGDYQLAQPYISTIDSSLSLTLFTSPYLGGFIRDNAAGQTNSIVVNGTQSPNLNATNYYYNVAIFGYNSGENITNSNNVALFGIGDGAALTSGGSIALGGIGSGSKVTTGTDNVAWGVSDLGSITTQGQNTAMGSGTLNSATGSTMSAFGYRAGYGNLGFGAFAGTHLTFLGALSGQASTATITDSTAVGDQAVISASHQVQLGSPYTTQVNTSATYNGMGLNSNVVTLAYSATPTIALAAGQYQSITLTGNVTGASLSGLTSGAHLSLQVCQDATGGHTWTPPAALHGAMTISTTASACSQQTFDSYNGTTMDALGPGNTVSLQ